jgi:60 kDa SS-A/Ro ribonucleoprotein
MPRRAVKAFRPLAPSTTAPSQNREGYPAWERPIREQYLQTLLTNTFGNAYYASERELAAESEKVHTAMLAESPEFAALALSYARERGYMRTQPIYGLARLFAAPPSGSPRLAKEIFSKVIRTPNDLADFTAIVKTLRNGEGGRAIKRAAGDWLIKNLNEYWVIKYGAEKRDGAYSLRDLLQVYHPNMHGLKSALFDYVMGRPEAVQGPQVAAFERLKRAETPGARALAIVEGRLPHEVATACAGDSKEVWRAIVPQLPIFALLRNLATLERHGVAEDQRECIEGKLLDPETIRHSKILPFRFVEAAKHVRFPWLADAVRGGLDLAFENVPEIDGLTDVAVDVSGSMDQYVQTAAVFGICLARRSGLRGKLFVFNTALGEVRVSARDSILSQAQQLRAGGGTDQSLVVSYLIQERRKIDNLVYVTDEQQNAGMPLSDLIGDYRRRVNRDLKVFIIDVGPYRSAITPGGKDDFYVYGWSDQALSFISMAARGFGSMADAIAKGEG